jgi:hypothetical protein
MYTLIATTKLNSVDPQGRLSDVLRRIADHLASQPHELGCLAELARSYDVGKSKISRGLATAEVSKFKRLCVNHVTLVGVICGLFGLLNLVVVTAPQGRRPTPDAMPISTGKQTVSDPAPFKTIFFDIRNPAGLVGFRDAGAIETIAHSGCSRDDEARPRWSSRPEEFHRPGAPRTPTLKTIIGGANRP